MLSSVSLKACGRRGVASTTWERNLAEAWPSFSEAARVPVNHLLML